MERIEQNMHESNLPTEGVSVICGPACSGKTAQVTELYRNNMRPDGRSSCMIITANFASQRYLKDRIMNLSSSGLVVSPNVTTFTSLAGKILSEHSTSAKKLPPIKRQLILGKIIAQLNEDKKLQSLGKVSDTPGLVTYVDTIISELKRAAADPADLKKIPISANPRQADLIEIYSSYQNYLQQADLFDVEGQMWLARDLLKSSGLSESLKDIDILAVDGFTDFTPTQLEILSLLGQHVSKVVITLPLDNDNRTKMWFWTRRTLERIKKAFGGNCSVITLKNDNPRPLHRGLFDPETQKLPHDDSVELFCANSSEDEIAQVAMQVKKLILNGAAPHSIAVLCNNLPQYHNAICRIFQSCDIPTNPAPQTLGDVAIIRFIIDFVSLSPKFEFDKMLAVISSSYFRPESLGDFSQADINNAQMIIREFNILESKESYLSAAGKLLNKLGSIILTEDNEPEPLKLGPVKITAEMISRVIDLFNAIFDSAEKISENPAYAIDLLDLRNSAINLPEPRLVSRDLRALKLFETITDDPEIKDTDINSLAGALQTINNPAARAESLVDVLSVLDARCLRYDHIFIIAMNEGTFPSRSTENSLLSTQQRNSLIKSGVPLDSRSDISASQMLLFYLAVTRYDKTLTLSYVSSDATGQSKARSCFIETLEGLFDEIKTNAIPAGQLFAESPDELISHEDFLNAGLWGLLNPHSTRQYSSAIKWAKQNVPEVINSIARGISARNHRYNNGLYDNFDGVINDKRLVDKLKTDFPQKVVFSASMLNTYGVCPWRFFAKYILKLEPLNVPAQQLQPTTHGTFIHEVLYSFFGELRDISSGPVNMQNFELEELYELLEKHVNLQSESLDAKAMYPELWEITKSQILTMLRRYMQDMTENFKISKLNPQPSFFEFAFGFKNNTDQSDPASVEDYAFINTDHGKARFRGKIDRVDSVEVNSQKAYTVVDYKTGSTGTKNDILEARNLQPVLYPLAIWQLVDKDAPIAGGSLHKISSSQSGSRELNFNRLIGRDVDKFDDQFGEVIAKVSIHLDNMRTGNFQVHPTTECPSYCPYRRICHYSPARREFKLSLMETEASNE